MSTLQCNPLRRHLQPRVPSVCPPCNATRGGGVLVRLRPSLRVGSQPLAFPLARASPRFCGIVGADGILFCHARATAGNSPNFVWANTQPLPLPPCNPPCNATRLPTNQPDCTQSYPPIHPAMQPDCPQINPTSHKSTRPRTADTHKRSQPSRLASPVCVGLSTRPHTKSTLLHTNQPDNAHDVSVQIGHSEFRCCPNWTNTSYQPYRAHGHTKPIIVLMSSFVNMGLSPIFNIRLTDYGLRVSVLHPSAHNGNALLPRTKPRPEAMPSTLRGFSWHVSPNGIAQATHSGHGQLRLAESAFILPACVPFVLPCQPKPHTFTPPRGFLLPAAHKSNASAHISNPPIRDAPCKVVTCFATLQALPRCHALHPAWLQPHVSPNGITPATHSRNCQPLFYGVWQILLSSTLRVCRSFCRDSWSHTPPHRRRAFHAPIRGVYRLATLGSLRLTCILFTSRNTVPDGHLLSGRQGRTFVKSTLQMSHSLRSWAFANNF